MKDLQIIWAALVGGVVSYCLVAYGMVAFGIDLLAFDPRIMNYVGAGALLWMAGGLWARRAMLEKIPPDLPPEDHMRRYQTAVLSALALIEGGGLLLITLGLISGTGPWILAGGGAAVALMVVARPTKEELGRRSAPPSTSR